MATPGNLGEGGHRPGRARFSGHNEGANKQASAPACYLPGVSSTAPHLFLGRSPPVGIVEG
jgi:hypothetical protein